MNRWEYPDNRTDFKLEASRFFLEKAQKINNIAGGEGHFLIQVILDGFLAEMIGAKDSLLHEINNNFKLNIPIKCVNLENINLRLNEKITKKIAREVLRDLNQISQREHWLWMLNEYRNHSIHRNIIPRNITVSPGVYLKIHLRKDPLDPNSGEGPELITFMKDSFHKMKKLVIKVRENYSIKTN